MKKFARTLSANKMLRRSGVANLNSSNQCAPSIQNQLSPSRAESKTKFLFVKLWLLVMLGSQTIFTSGCTSVLWDKNTFAHYYEPADPPHLQLFYSENRKDVLVQYAETNDFEKTTRLRSFWLEQNAARINSERKPHFVSARAADGLIPIRVLETLTNSTRPSRAELVAIAPRNDDLFTLYLGNEKLDPYQLPKYIGTSRRVKQVLLTPAAVSVDATVIGAVIAYYAAPQLLSGLNH